MSNSRGPPMNTIDLMRLSAGCWNSHTERLDYCLRDQDDPEKQYLFIQDDPFSYSGSGKLQSELIRYFQIPQYLLAVTYRRSNGFFAFKESRGQNGQRESCYMWFRVEIKIIDDSSGMRYHWHEMTFCYRWDSKSCSILCLGVDASFRSCLQEKLQQIWPDIQGSQPGCLLVPLIEVLVITYDQSVWSMRDIVRQAEKNRTHSTRGITQSELLYEATRHAIHSSETLEAALNTLSSIQHEIASQSMRSPSMPCDVQDLAESINKRLDFQVRMLRNLHLRAQSNKERVQNENVYAFNMATQRDSQIMKELGVAATEDSSAMRTIAVVTMFFLPPTFISAVFSMSFFNYTPPQDDKAGKWSVSERFWVYWAFAIPLTALTLGIWILRQRWMQWRYWLNSF
ncbi:hypothetical protein COCCADRAFT_4439 [Bipolaris zeicola 26-R-13]|uniref:Uncharacterized protein n=1 Tax=Cochliobolus carbonum (strain 26-R-13) TaxID=930089 RepID=W6Y310_COCC2|nr:uncharacterized protein COCCADRAFT_4439 [Bipolaris zeicola 26-R-13]EUC34092.1 hypothetical protein COCCADRAFT_4439 [Bipolaris zeicola 26-R-13]